jgi:tripartite-type tricarboxylate transporter receptor subunit TctC
VVGISYIGHKTAIFVACLMAAGSMSAHADNYPARAITAVVPQVPGGGADSVARVVLQRMASTLGQAIVVDNRVGASGIIGTRYAARAKNDGYTLLFTSTSHVINALLRKDAGYDAIRDFEPVALVAKGPFVMVANPGFAAQTTAQLIALAKKSPGTINYGSVGVGSFNHLLGVMLETEAGIKLQHVPYKGSPEAAAAVIGGQVPISFNDLASTLPLIRSGKLRALGVSTAQASPLAPEIPPISAAVPGYDATSWYAVLVPAGTPKQDVSVLATSVQKALNDPGVRKTLGLQGVQTAFGGPEQLHDFLTLQARLWGDVIKHTGLTSGD